MPEYRIEVAGRYFKRQFQKAVGKSVLKVLTELMTNADDSYRRLTAHNAGGSSDRSQSSSTGASMPSQ